MTTANTVSKAVRPLVARRASDAVVTIIGCSSTGRASPPPADDLPLAGLIVDPVTGPNRLATGLAERSASDFRTTALRGPAMRSRKQMMVEVKIVNAVILAVILGS